MTVYLPDIPRLIGGGKLELQVSKWCYECRYTEVLWRVPISQFVGINLTSKVNLTCRNCKQMSIRLDAKVVNVLVVSTTAYPNP